MKLRKLALDAALGVALTGALLLVLEGALWALGIGAADATAGLSRGFDPSAAYFVADPDVPGGFRTQFANRKIPDRPIAAKGERTRVLLFGGSNTAGFPAGWMQRELNACGAAERFEVINLGRPGFGSERVSIIFTQALELLEPDVVIVYSGHNEFVERGFQIDLDRSRSGVWGSALSVAEATRVGRTVMSALGPSAEPTTRSATPEDWRSEYDKFAELEYAETLRYFDAYEANLRRMARAAEAAGVPLLLATVIHNRFAAPFVASAPAELSAPERTTFETEVERARAEYPAYFAALLPSEEAERVHQFDWGPPGREDKGGASAAALPPLRASRGALADRDPCFNPPELWKPKVASFYQALARLFARDGVEDAALERARARLESALALAPEHARLHFELGLVLYAAGAPLDDVQAALDRAGRLDRAPRKATGLSNDRVRKVAREVAGAELFDADELFSERAPDGLIGWEWMTDHCHLSLGAMRVLMEDFAERICRSRAR